MLNNNSKGMENGYVVLPVERYEELVLAAQAAQAAIHLETEYGGQVAVRINSRYIYDIAKKQYETSELNTPERELKAIDTFSVYSATLTNPVPTGETE